MRLQTGTRLGRYEIVALLGAGGMGEVYRAHDLTLRRDVAVKVVVDRFAADDDRLKRFEREAMATAALNHPNIVAILDVGSHDGITYIVSELLDGRPLDGLLADGALPLRKALRFAAQIADGLGAAHARGIVHRDVKPANVFVTADDRVKILDFGLARMVSASDAGLTETTATALTTTGAVLGSSGYMAPEQVRGLEVDHRADIFSFGVTFYEMLTGQRAFRRDTVAGTLAAIVEAEPPSWSGDGSAAALHAMRLVRRCLEKSPNDRFQSARDLALVLADTSSDLVPPMSAGPPASKAPAWRGWLVGGLVGAALGAAIWAWRPPSVSPAVESPPVTFEITAPDGWQFGNAPQPAITNDGGQVAFVAQRQGKSALFVRSLSDLGSRELPGTTGASQPFFSPDGARIAFFADGNLKVITIDSGAVVTVCKAPSPRGGTWTDDGAIVFADGTFTPLSRVSPTGGPLEPLTTLAAGEASHRFPQALPGGGLIFNVVLERGGGQVAVFAPNARQHTVVVEHGDAPQFSRGRLFYMNDHREWMAVPFDAATHAVTGPAEAQPGYIGNGAFQGDAAFRVSRGGSTVYLPYLSSLRSLAIVERDGRLTPVPGPPRPFDAMRLSPDGSRVATTITAPTGDWGDVWIGDLAGNFVPFTQDGFSRYAVWSPAGDRLAFTSRRMGIPAVFIEPSSRGTAIRLTDGTTEALPSGWLPDGRSLLVNFSNPRGATNTIAVVTEGNPTPSVVSLPVTRTAFARVSPDGRWLAYTTNDSGEWEVSVTTFPTSGRTWQVSAAKTGREPLWAPGGERLFFRRADGSLVAVAMTPDGPAPGSPQAVSVGGATLVMTPASAGIPRYDVFPDGRLLVMREESPTRRLPPLVVVAR